MANWDKITSFGSVQDRRASPGVIGGGLSVTGLLIVLLFNYLSGGDLGDVISQLDPQSVTQSITTSNEDTAAYQGQDLYEVFTSKVLGSLNDVWVEILGSRYQEPTLVLFRNSTNSECGGATSMVGPHYCPYDETIYLDETFFDELVERFGGNGDDVAQAYVIAHEVGHHVQNLQGLLSESGSNEVSVQQELQADCFAGIWAHYVNELGVLEEGEVREAIDAAASVGDDRIQAKTTGRINPETWTHGSSNERVAAFMKGYSAGTYDACKR